MARNTRPSIGRPIVLVLLSVVCSPLTALAESAPQLEARLASLRLASVPLPGTADELVVDEGQALEVFLSPSDFPDALVRFTLHGEAADFAINFDLSLRRGEAILRRVRWPQLVGRRLEVQGPGGGIMLTGLNTAGAAPVENSADSGEMRLLFYVQPEESDAGDIHRGRLAAVHLTDGDDRTLAAWFAPAEEVDCRAVSEGNDEGLRCRIGGVSRAVRAVAVDPSGQWIAVAGGDLRPRVDLRDRSTFRLVRRVTFPPWLGSPLHVAFTDDGRHLVVTDAGGTVHLWDAATGGRHRQIDADAGAVVVLDSGRSIAAADADGGITIWRVRDGTIVHRLRNRSGAVRTIVAASGDGLRVAGLRASEGGDVVVWNLEDQRVVGRVGGGASSSLVDLLLDGPGEHMYAAHDGEGLLRAPVASPSEWASWGGTIGQQCRGRLALSPNQRFLACTLDRGAALFELASGRSIRTVGGGAEGVMLDDLAFSPEGDGLIAVGSGALYEWSLAPALGGQR